MVDIDLVGIEQLRPHEGTEEGLLNSLRESMVHLGTLIDPLMVDASTLVVLDGMHRLAALKAIDAKGALVCRLSYSDPLIGVHRWIRCLDRLPASRLAGLARDLGLKRARDEEEAIEGVDVKSSSLAVISPGISYVSEEPCSNIFDCYGRIDRLWSRLKGEGIRLELKREDEALAGLGSSHEAFIYAPRIAKRDILKAGLEGRLFPPKATRHNFHLRPVNFDVPLALLRDTPLEEARQVLEERVKAMAVAFLGPKASYRGRVYEETLALLQSKEFGGSAEAPGSAEERSRQRDHRD